MSDLLWMPRNYRLYIPKEYNVKTGLKKKYRLKIQTLPKIITHASPNMSIIPASAENILKIVNYLFEK